MKTRIKIDAAIVTVAVVLTIGLYQFPHIFSTNRTLDNIWDFTGIIFVLKGTMIRMISRGYKKANSRKGKVLVVDGVYQLTRNPMYLGSFYIGLGFVLTLWPVWTVPVYAGLFYLRFKPQVEFEEALLGDMFGKEYEDYCRRVPRVFPKFAQLRRTQLKEIVNIEQALSTKDKYGLLLWPLAVLLLESIHEFFVFGATNIPNTLMIGAGAAVFYAVVLAARYYKSV